MVTVVKVIYLGLIQNTMGRRAEEIELPEGATIKELVRTLTRVHGERFKTSVLSINGELRPTATILVEGRDIQELQGFDTSLRGAREATIVVTVHPMSGG
ncbi:MAG: MoaD/ThiS family protein [Chloroflexi bacterium]|nr:MoaD/ThiS family protein [Chloroflexota bacterium]